MLTAVAINCPEKSAVDTLTGAVDIGADNSVSQLKPADVSSLALSANLPVGLNNLISTTLRINVLPRGEWILRSFSLRSVHGRP